MAPDLSDDLQHIACNASLKPHGLDLHMRRLGGQG